MSDSVIIDARGHLPLVDRIQEEASTAAVWGVWLWLCRPLFMLHKMIIGLSFESVILLSGTCGVLLLWDKLLPKPRLVSYNTPAVCNLGEVQNAKICTVHHDEYGNIINIEVKV